MGNPASRKTHAGAQMRKLLPFLLLVSPLLVLIISIFIFPIGRVVITSLFDPEFTLGHYSRVFEDDIYLRVLWTTIKISTLTALLCLILGYPIAYIMAEARPSIRTGLVAVVTLAFFMSLLVKNYSWTVILQDTGTINVYLQKWGIIEKPLPLMYNLFGVLVAMVHMLLPFMILPLYSVFSQMDRQLRQASQGLGASSLRTFWHITLPLSLAGVGAGVFIVFVVSLGFFITPALLGSPAEMMLANLIDNQIRDVLNWPFASALGSLLLGISLFVFLIYHRYFGSESIWEQA